MKKIKNSKYYLSEENIKSYYKICKLFLPQYPNFRIWKFRIFDGTKKGKIIQIKDQIRNIEILRKHLLKHLPIDVYYSSGCFRNPTQVHGSKTHNHLLFRNIPFDIDADKPYGKEELDITRQSTIYLIDKIEYELDIKPIYICFTGKKGFQIIYSHKDLNINKIKEMKLNGIDKEVTTDIYRVIRLPLTINQSGRLAIFLTEKELRKGMDYILKKSKIIYSPQDCGDRAGKPLKANDGFSLPSKVNGEDSEVCSNRPSLTAKYITNEVAGTKRYIPILKYRYREITYNPKEDIQLLAEKYGLNEWFAIKTLDEVIYISLASFDKARLKKILNSTRAELSKAEFKKWGKVFIRTSSYINGEDKPVPLGIITFSNYTTKQFLYSKPHTNFINHFNFQENPYSNYIGYDKPKIYLTIKE